MQRASSLIEMKLREIVKYNSDQLNDSVQLKIQRYLLEKGKTIDKLNLGEIIGLLEKTKFWGAWQTVFDSDLELFETI